MLVLSTVNRDYPRFSNGFDNSNIPHEETLRRLEDGIDEWIGATLTVILPVSTEQSDEDSGEKGKRNSRCQCCKEL